MSNWETTAFGILAAIGQVLQHATGVPPWVNTVGEICNAAGVAGLGYTAASIRAMSKAQDASAANTAAIKAVQVVAVSDVPSPAAITQAREAVAALPPAKP